MLARNALPGKHDDNSGLVVALMLEVCSGFRERKKVHYPLASAKNQSNIFTLHISDVMGVIVLFGIICESVGLYVCPSHPPC